MLSILWGCAVCSCEVEIGLVRYCRRRRNELLKNVDIDCVGSLSEIDWRSVDFVDRERSLCESWRIAVVCWRCWLICM